MSKILMNIMLGSAECSKVINSDQLIYIFIMNQQFQSSQQDYPYNHRQHGRNSPKDIEGSPISRSIHSYKSSMSLQKHPLRERSIIESIDRHGKDEFGSILLTELNSKRKHNNYDPNSEEVLRDHKQFLNNYKKQREKELKQLQTTQEDKESSDDDQQMQQRRRSSSMMEQTYEPSTEQMKQHRMFIADRMKQIHGKIQHEIYTQDMENERQRFKVFTDVVETKNDIGRVVKERRFMKSQQSKYIQYKEPEMLTKNKLPRQYRVNTEGVYDQNELSRRAKEFVERVHKEQQNLLGKHLMRRKIEQAKRKIEEREQNKKLQQLNDIKREQRKMKAEQHLKLMKQKVKISQLINRKNLEQLNAMMVSHRQVNQARHSLNSQNQVIPENRVKKTRYTIDSSEDKDEKVKRWKLNQIKQTTDRISSNKDSQNNYTIRERVALKKQKFPKPKPEENENSISRLSKDGQTDEISDVPPKKSSRSAIVQQSPIHEIKYPSSDYAYEEPDDESVKNKVSSEFNTYTAYEERQIETIEQQKQKERESKFKRERATPISSLQ